MTKPELEYIQTVCHDWLRQPGTANDSRRTISPSSALSRTVQLKITVLLTFDDVLIKSVVDAETGACYTKLIANSVEAGEFIDTPFESIAPDTAIVAGEPKVLTATQKQYQESRARLRDLEQNVVKEPIAANQIEMDSWSWMIPESERNAGDAGAKFLLYTNRKLLGYSLLERALSTQKKRGRFHPSDDYFEYAEFFAALPEAENECMEANVQEAYGLEVAGAEESRLRYSDLLVRLEVLRLHVENEDGEAIDAVEIKLEDLSRYYDDEAERWLYVTFNVAR